MRAWSNACAARMPAGARIRLLTHACRHRPFFSAIDAQQIGACHQQPRPWRRIGRSACPRDVNSSARSAGSAGLAALARTPRARRKRAQDGRLARAQRARDLADRHRRAGAELPPLCRSTQGPFGQSFVLENMPGGSGAIGCMAVARAAPDGHTLLLASNSHIVLAPLVLSSSPVNVKRDFAPIALMFTFPFLLLVNPGLPVRRPAGARRLRQGAAGRAQLRLAGRRDRRPSGDGADGEAHRHPGRARAVSGDDAADAGGSRRHPAVHLRHRRQCPRHGGRRQGGPARGHRARAAPPPRPTCRRSRSSATMASTTCSSPMACSAPTGTSPAMIRALNREMVRMNASGTDPREIVAGVLRARHAVAGGVWRDDRPRAQALGRRGAGDRRAREGLIDRERG